ncbi:SBBP repeat-containing protein [Micromonospora sp. RP3T]
MTSGRGNTITPRALAADAQGRIYVGGSAAAQSPTGAT